MNTLVEKWEGYHKRLPDGTCRPYLCPANVPTIGFGSTRWEDGSSVRLGDPAISRDRATLLCELELNRLATRIVSRYSRLTKGQLDALVSFSYNLGIGALFGSTLWKKILRGDDKESIAKEFGKWVYAGGRKLPGLVARRAEESVMFLS